MDEDALVVLERDFNLVLANQLRNKPRTKDGVRDDFQLAIDLLAGIRARRAATAIHHLLPSRLRLRHLALGWLLAGLVALFSARTPKRVNIVAARATHTPDLVFVATDHDMRCVSLTPRAERLNFLTDVVCFVIKH
ncbi:MAG TPA: hypothetical protein PKI03_26410 [Pseudomonadota bacterium]|nr:hypothetical protein [Pseudomonadota bacterium]